MRRRVVVVDDDDISRRGLAELLSDHPGIEIVGVYSHGEALTEPVEWAGVDVVVVDAADERRRDDHFPGVGVVERVRAEAGSRPSVIVLTGHFFDDAVRRRMREAQADLFFHRSELQDVDRLHEVVLNPHRFTAGVPVEQDRELLFRHGVTGSTRVNAALAHARDAKLAERLEGRSDPRSRAWLRMRTEFNRAARLNPVNADGRPPDRDQNDPSVPQIQRFLEWATRVKRPNPPSR